MKERRACPNKNKPSADMVMTPPLLAERIVRHFDPRGLILDPCCGKGAFFDAICEHCGDVGGIHSVEWMELSEGRDFLAFEPTMQNPVPWNWIVTNPPWSKFVDFLVQAMSVANHVVFLVTLNHFQTRARMRMIENAGFRFREILLIETPPKPWPQSGFQVAAVHIERGWTGDCKFSRLAS